MEEGLMNKKTKREKGKGKEKEKTENQNYAINSGEEIVDTYG